MLSVPQLLLFILFQGLLKELEEFAFQGCTKPMTYDTAAAGENVGLRRLSRDTASV